MNQPVKCSFSSEGHGKPWKDQYRMLSSLQLQSGGKIREVRSNETWDALIGNFASKSCLQSGQERTLA